MAEEQKQKRSIWLVWVAAVLAVVFVGPIVGAVVKKVTDSLLADWDRKDAYNSIKEQVQRNLPQKVDEVTTAVDFKIDRNAAEYLYELSEDVTSFDLQEIRRNKLAGICTVWKEQFIKGVTAKAVYAYRLKDVRYAFEVNAADCANDFKSADIEQQNAELEAIVAKNPDRYELIDEREVEEWQRRWTEEKHRSGIADDTAANTKEAAGQPRKSRTIVVGDDVEWWEPGTPLFSPKP